MDVAAAFASGLVAPPPPKAPATGGGGEMDVAGDDGGSSSAEPPQPQPAVPVHVTISITEGGAGAIDFGIDHVSPALLTSRPRLKPGRQVVQLTITGCPLQIDGKENNKLSAVHDEVARSIPTVRSVAVKTVSKEDASGIIGALIPREPSRWRVVPNLVSLLLSDLVGDFGGGDEMAGAHPVRTIGQGIELFNQLPALQELVLLNCQTPEADVEPLAAALKKGNAPQLRVFNCGNNQQRGNNPESSTTDLLLRALASGARPRHRLQVLSFADNWSFVDAPLTCFRAALNACPGLRKLNLDSSKTPISEVLDLADAVSAGDLPQLEYVCLTVPVVDPKDEPWKAIEILTRAAASKVPPVLLEVRLAD